MVRQYGDADRFIPGAYLVEDRPNEALVKILDGLELQLQVAIMSSLVARLYVNIHKIIAILQGLDSRSRLALVVGVGKTRSPLNDDVAETCIMTDATNQIHCRNHGTLLNLRIHLREGEHVRTVAAAPRPDDVGHALATLLACHVERMVLQNLLTLQNQFVQKVGSLLCTHAILVAQCAAILSHILGRSLVAVAGKQSSINAFHRLHEQGFPFLVRMVVRRCAIHILVTALDDKQMAILDARDKLHDARILAGELLVQILDEHISVFRLQVAAVVGYDDAVVHIYDVAAQGEIVRTHLVADAGSLQRSASLVNLILVVAHD